MPFPLRLPAVIRALFCAAAGLLFSIQLNAREIPIPVTQTEIDGAALGVQPGDVLLLEAGERPFLKIDHVVGSPKAAVIIRNHGGTVVMRNPDRYYNIFVQRSRYFRITGSGEAATPRGIFLDGTGPHGSGVMVAGLSSDFELDHLHIAHPGFAGLLLKTDGAIGAYQDNVNVHDNYIHDTGGEGIYLGETQPVGQEGRHVHIWNNVIARAGWEACQLAHAIADVEVHHNVFYHAGGGKLLWQDNNFQLTADTACNFHDNLVIGANSHLVIANGGAEKIIRNNYFGGTVTGPGLNLNDSNVAFVPNGTITVEKNFFRGIHPVQPVVLFNGEKTILRVQHNVWEGENQFLRFQPIEDLSQIVLPADNRNAPVPQPRFVDEAHDDFRLVDGDPYKALGMGLLPQ